MNTKKRLNCYIFSNLIISFLTFNMLTNTETTSLVKKTSNNVLNKIYEKGNKEYSSIQDTLITIDETSNNTTSTKSVVTISNKVNQSENNQYVKPSYNNLTGSNLVNYALKFVGLRYVSAGNSLATGTDCSGFTSLIYKEFGITLGRTVASQLYSGSYVSKNDLEPGDLIFYSYGTIASHVTIYIGNGQIVHESNPRDGVKVSTMNIMNYITARRLITSNVTISNDNQDNLPIEEANSNETSEAEIEEIPEVISVEENEPILNETLSEENKTISDNNAADIIVDTNKEEITLQVSDTEFDTSELIEEETE